MYRVYELPRRQPAARFNRQAGRSLLELLFTLAVAAATAAVAVPGFQDWLSRQRLVSQTNSLVRDLHFSRNTSITTGADVLMCESSNRSACTLQPDWRAGWVVFADQNGNRQRDPEESILTVNTGFFGSMKFKAAGRYGYRNVVYRPTGRAKNGTFTLCSPDGQARAVVLHMSGRPRVSYSKADGSALDCPAS